jgi:hydroxymethylbilane synthase
MSDVLFRLGTRGSPLAMAQAHETRARLCAAHGLDPGRIAIVEIKVMGDQILDRALALAGGKGLFTRELDQALIDGAIDFAVHSAKDVPTFLPPQIEVAGYLPREDARDVFIGAGGTRFAEVAQGATIGSASLRRQAMIRRARPDLKIGLLRGNVQTRLRKLEEGQVAGTLLALAGLKRLGLEDRATEIFDIDAFLPPVGQAAIAIAARVGDARTRDFLAPALDAATGVALACERAFLAVLDGSCRTPIAGHARLVEGRLRFTGLLLREDGSEEWSVSREGAAEDAARMGEEAGRDIRTRAPQDALAHGALAHGAQPDGV